MNSNYGCGILLIDIILNWKPLNFEIFKYYNDKIFNIWNKIKNNNNKLFCNTNIWIEASISKSKYMCTNICMRFYSFVAF